MEDRWTVDRHVVLEVGTPTFADCVNGRMMETYSLRMSFLQNEDAECNHSWLIGRGQSMIVLLLLPHSKAEVCKGNNCLDMNQSSERTVDSRCFQWGCRTQGGLCRFSRAYFCGLVGYQTFCKVITCISIIPNSFLCAGYDAPILQIKWGSHGW